MSQLVTETGRGVSGVESGPSRSEASGLVLVPPASPVPPASLECAIHVLTKVQIRELCGRSRRPGRPARPARPGTKRTELPRVTA